MNRDIFSLSPYSLKKEQKEAFLLKKLQELTLFHKLHCPEYANILLAFGYKEQNYKTLEDFFALPVRLFKEYDLKSSNEIVKTLTSSGTTSTQVSKIYLDKETARLQTKALIKIMQDFLSAERLPMLILDTKAILKDRKKFSARAAGVMGLANFGRKHIYAFDEHMNLDREAILAFQEEYKDQKVLLFGFTFMIWQYFYKELRKENIKLHLDKAILFHSGGWKKLEDEAVSDSYFKESLAKQTGIKNIHNFYGMVEQVGSIFVACEYGHLHTPNFADIIIRDPFSLEVLEHGKEGIIELLSIIPQSYPGHILLSEDRGVILGEDDCKCGRCGKYFKVLGRIKEAEVRGCSDTFEGK